MTFHINSFARRQTAASHFTHWTRSDVELVMRVAAGFPNATPGYKEGVLQVPIRPDGFYSPVVKLSEGDILIGKYTARREGETPRKQLMVAKGEKLPARSVNVILYSHAVLAETEDAETEADYEIISVNASTEVGVEPIQPETLCANHFGDDGGTSTGMSDAEFIAALKESRAYWKGRALLADKDTIARVGLTLNKMI